MLRVYRSRVVFTKFYFIFGFAWYNFEWLWTDTGGKKAEICSKPERMRKNFVRLTEAMSRRQKLTLFKKIGTEMSRQNKVVATQMFMEAASGSKPRITKMFMDMLRLVLSLLNDSDRLTILLQRRADRSPNLTRVFLRNFQLVTESTFTWVLH